MGYRTCRGSDFYDQESFPGPPAGSSKKTYVSHDSWVFSMDDPVEILRQWMGLFRDHLGAGLAADPPNQVVLSEFYDHRAQEPLHDSVIISADWSSHGVIHDQIESQGSASPNLNSRFARRIWVLLDPAPTIGPLKLLSPAAWRRRINRVLADAEREPGRMLAMMELDRRAMWGWIRTSQRIGLARSLIQRGLGDTTDGRSFGLKFADQLGSAFCGWAQCHGRLTWSWVYRDVDFLWPSRPYTSHALSLPLSPVIGASMTWNEPAIINAFVVSNLEDYAKVNGPTWKDERPGQILARLYRAATPSGPEWGIPSLAFRQAVSTAWPDPNDVPNEIRDLVSYGEAQSAGVLGDLMEGAGATTPWIDFLRDFANQ